MDAFLVAFPGGIQCRVDHDEDGNGKCKIECYTEEQHVNLRQLLFVPVPVDEGTALLAHIHSEHGDQTDDHDRECDCFHINLQIMQSKKSSEE